MKKYQSVKKLRMGRPRPRQGNLLVSLTAALLAAILSLTSTPATALGLNCTASATGVDFGNYNPTNSSPTDATGNIHVFCTVLLVSVLAQTNITLSTGGGTYADRKMSSGAELLSYNLYKEATHATVWGDGTGGTGIWTDNTLILVLGTSIDHTIYGSIPAGQYVAAGNYSDTITVTVEYHEAI